MFTTFEVPMSFLMWFKRLAFILFACSFQASAVVVLQYHHVSDDTPPSTSISVEQFSLHMNYLKQNDFNVLPLPQVLQSLKEKKSLPLNTVAITFDDGYENVFTKAAPILTQYNFPYTIFIAPKEISAGYSNLLSWQQIKQMSENGVTFANHSLEHLHLNRTLENETQEQWLARIEKDITSAQTQIIEKTGQDHKLLAYPYGEYNSALQQLVAKLGFIGIGQHSGAISQKSDFTALPRFPASGRYASLKTLKVKLKSMSMPVISLLNANPQLDQHPLNGPQYKPELTVKIDSKDLYVQTLNCYILGEKVAPNWIDKQHFTIVSPVAIPSGRSRYNCTAQSRTKSGYYWFSQPWIKRNSDGSWYKN